MDAFNLKDIFLNSQLNESLKVMSRYIQEYLIKESITKNKGIIERNLDSGFPKSRSLELEFIVLREYRDQMQYIIDGAEQIISVCKFH